MKCDNPKRFFLKTQGEDIFNLKFLRNFSFLSLLSLPLALSRLLFNIYITGINFILVSLIFPFILLHPVSSHLKLLPRQVYIYLYLCCVRRSSENPWLWKSSGYPWAEILTQKAPGQLEWVSEHKDDLRTGRILIWKGKIHQNTSVHPKGERWAKWLSIYPSVHPTTTSQPGSLCMPCASNPGNINFQLKSYRFLFTAMNKFFF